MTLSMIRHAVNKVLSRVCAACCDAAIEIRNFSGLFAGALSLQKGALFDDFFNIFIAVAISAASVVAQRKIKIERATKKLRKVLSLYTTPELADFILNDAKGDMLHAEERVITVLFCDIRGYTTLSEKKSPQEVVALLNRYFASMSEEILRFQGVINKYIGDAILAFWEESPKEYCQAEKALFASAAMLRKLDTLNNELATLGFEPISVGIGICTGLAMVGNVGSATKYDFTVIGDVVNVASRLQSLTKEYKVPVIISDATRRALTAKNLFALTSLGTAHIRGKEREIPIFTLDSSHF